MKVKTVIEHSSDKLRIFNTATAFDVNAWNYFVRNEQMTIEGMIDSGGSFAATIAKAYERADSHNKARILAAFGDLFMRYCPGYVNAGGKVE